MDKTPIYKKSFEYAYQHGESKLHHASRQSNIACKEAIEKAIADHYSGYCLNTSAAVQEVVKQFGFDRMFYVLANTVQANERDGRISSSNKKWAQTIPVVFEKGMRDVSYLITHSHLSLLDMFLRDARHMYLLRQPLKAADIRAEAAHILEGFQAAQEPNSPNKTHFMVQVSPDFLARANTKDHDRLIDMLPFSTLSISTLKGQTGTYALIRADEDRNKKLRLRKLSVRKKLQEQPNMPRPSNQDRHKEQGVR